MNGVAIVTGGTGTIGRHTDKVLSGEGWTTVVGDILPPEGPEQGKFVRLDVTSQGSVDGLVAEASSLGEIGALVINHATIEPTDPYLYDDGVVQRALDVNLKGAVKMLHAVAPRMRANGSIVLISSVSASIGGIQGSYAYQATKAAIEQISRHFAVALGERGIRVNCVAPGFMEHPPRGAGATVRASATATGGRSRDNPLGRRPKAEEVAEVIAFLCSDRASAVDGVVLPVDCGFLAM